MDLLSKVYCSDFKNSVIVAVCSDKVVIVLHCHFRTGDGQKWLSF